MSEIDTIIQKYIQGNTSADENEQLQQWLQESLDNKKRMFAEKDIWDTFNYKINGKKFNVKHELEFLKKSIEIKNPSRSILHYHVLKIAAILLITFGLGWSSHFISFFGYKNQIAITMQEIFVPKGQINQVFLADGTRIWINSETQLIIPSVFAINERTVKLNGEAFFEVAKDKNRPFKVEVKGQQIEVTGTSFNVRAYNNSNDIETTLQTGEIRLNTGDQTFLLKSGEQSIFGKNNSRINIVKVDPASFSAWKDGRYEFQSKDLIEVFKVVERWYDVEISADETSFKGMHFSGVIKRNKDAKHFLDMLNHSVPINYKINSEKIQITLK